MRVQDLRAGTADPWARVAEWILGSNDQSKLIAIDAPLGWPRPLAEALGRHKAGEPVEASADELFSRTTDQKIRARFGLRPLEVGADRIARTARAAMSQLQRLRNKIGSPVKLAWCPCSLRNEGTWVIEVYPAATLKAHDLPFKSYKKQHDNAHREKREAILDGLKATGTGVDVSERFRETALGNADGLDALVCLLAASDFLRGDASPPDDRSRRRATHEGWIWCKEDWVARADALK